MTFQTQKNIASFICVKYLFLNCEKNHDHKDPTNSSVNKIVIGKDHMIKKLNRMTCNFTTERHLIQKQHSIQINI